MCDIEIKQFGEPCVNGNRFVCTNGGRCPNAVKLPGESGAAMTRLCDMHASFCEHCGRSFCKSCHPAHQQQCLMRPVGESAWDRVRRVYGEASAT